MHSRLESETFSTQGAFYALCWKVRTADEIVGRPAESTKLDGSLNV